MPFGWRPPRPPSCPPCPQRRVVVVLASAARRVDKAVVVVIKLLFVRSHKFLSKATKSSLQQETTPIPFGAETIYSAVCRCIHPYNASKGILALDAACFKNMVGTFVGLFFAGIDCWCYK